MGTIRKAEQGTHATPGAVMPAGIANAYVFQVFNATSWSLILSTPMLLYLKNLGASATVLGINVALIPLFSALQIPAAAFVERVGYKTFVVRGWASRSVFILGLAATAMLPAALSPAIRIALALGLLACFAAVRGVSMCGYLPWITGLVPEPLRGTFISRDTMCMHLAVAGTMLLSSFWVGIFPSSRAFAVLFLFSYVAALLGVAFLRRIPDVPAGADPRSSGRPPWKEMILYPPFFRYALFTVVFNVFVSALGVIWVPYMRDSYGASGSLILGLSAYASVIAAAASLVVGPVTDRVGSRPLLAVASGLVVTGQSLWMAMAAGALPHRALLLFGITTFGATGFAVISVANMRLLMGLVPVMGRSHFFAISSVATSLTMGLMPILWGLALDGAGRIMADGMPLARHWTWNRYSFIYAVVVTGLLGAQFLRHRLDEPRAMSTEEFMRILLVQSPARLVVRAFQPLRRFLPPS
jgi:MFS family permease